MFRLKTGYWRLFRLLICIVFSVRLHSFFRLYMYWCIQLFSATVDVGTLHKPKIIHTIQFVWWQADSDSHYPRCHHGQIPVMSQIRILRKINKFWNVTLLIEWKLFLSYWVLCAFHCICIVFVCTNKRFFYIIALKNHFVNNHFHHLIITSMA